MSESPQGLVSFGLPLPALRFYFPAVYLGGERPGRPGRGSQNKVPIVAAVCLNDAGNPLYVKVTPVAAFSNAAISSWAWAHLQPGCAVLNDGLGNLKTMLSRAYRAYRFNRCLDLAGLVT